MANPLLPLLVSGIEQLGVDVSQFQLQQLTDYILLVQRWNKAFNLTAVRDLDGMVVKHLLDSLAVSNYVQSRRLIDVGTGAGFPGIPLAIAQPECDVTLLDSNGKKTRFLFQVKTGLKLNNVSIVESRVEAHHPTTLYDAVISRAFASLPRMVDSCRHLLEPDGTLYAMKAAAVTEEINQLDHRGEVLRCQQLSVPYLNESRSLVALKLS